tara:strand:+ start:10970 stop:13528 length:2559 start_codon:yes stop_codon:yes gene_type:complete
MPLNYVISRDTTDDPSGATQWGCTDFSTVQVANQVADDIPGASLDGSITWNIDAATGYTVNVDDFYIPNAIVTTGGGYTTYGQNAALSALPPEVLAVSFSQASNTQIQVIIWLSDNTQTVDPDFALQGQSSFMMPSSNYLIQVPIFGCAKLFEPVIGMKYSYTATGKNLTSTTNTPGTGITSTVANNGSTRTFTISNPGSTTHPLSATVTDIANPNTMTKLFSHTFTADSGYYFSTHPEFVIPQEFKSNYRVDIASTTYSAEKYQQVADKTALARGLFTLVNKVQNTKKLTSITFDVYYSNTVDSDSDGGNELTLNYETALIATKEVEEGIGNNVLQSLNINLPSIVSTNDNNFRTSESVIAPDGGVINFDFSGDSTYDNRASLPGFNMKVWNSSYHYYNFTTGEWQEDEFTLSKRLFDGIYQGKSVYPPPKFFLDKLLPSTKTSNNWDPEDIVNYINFPPLKTNLAFDTVNTSFTLTNTDGIPIEIIKGTKVSGSGVTSGTKVKSVAGNVIILDKPLTATASDVNITFEKDLEVYYVGLSANSGSTATTFNSNLPTYSSPRVINQFKHPTITIVGYSQSGQFSIPAGVSKTVNINSNPTNGISVAFSATVAPSGGKSDVQVKSVGAFGFGGFQDVTLNLYAESQKYKTSSQIQLDRTKGISPGMRVKSSAFSATYTVNLFRKDERSASLPRGGFTFKSSNLTHVTVGDEIVGISGVTIPSGTFVTSRSEADGYQYITVDNPLSAFRFDEPYSLEKTYEVYFKSTSSALKIDEYTYVESVDSETQVTLSKSVDLTNDDVLTFTSDNLTLKSHSLIATEDGANVVISGDIIMSKLSKLDTTIFVNLDELLTES